MPRTPKPDPSAWTPEAISRLGYDSDAAIGRSIGRSREAVRLKREQMGIPSSGLPTGPAPRRGEVAQPHAIRLTPVEISAFTAAAGGKPWREWALGVLRKAAGLE